MKKILALLLAVCMIACMFAGCKPTGKSNGGNGEYDYDAIPDNMTSEDGKYEIAFVTDVGQLKDKSFNQGTWEGIKRYAKENDKSYKYYKPANDHEATDDDRYNAMKAAIEGGAQVVICAGFMQETALRMAAVQYPDSKFVFIDGYPVQAEPTQFGEDGNALPNDSPVLTNIAPISFQEEQAGYLAGYAAVKEGYTKLGFSGGGGGANPACCKFGYGYVQGVQAAAAEMGVQVEMNYSWAYGATFSDSADLQTMLNGWYANGTECIFVCGGPMCLSAFAAAAANDGVTIGVDVDQSGDSETVITSATKGLRESVTYACDVVFKGDFSAMGGIQTVLGAKDNAVGLPTATWSLEKFSVEDYNKLFEALKNGSVVVDADWNNMQTEYANLKINII